MFGGQVRYGFWGLKTGPGFCIGIGVFALFLFAFTSLAQAELQFATLAEISIPEQTPPYILHQNFPRDVEEGRPEQLFFDALARTVFTDAGLSFIEQPQQPWKRAYQETLYGPRHVVYPTTRIEDRENKLKWVGPISRTVWNLYSLKNSVWENRKIADIFNSARIGVTLGSAREHYLRKRGAKHIVAVARDEQLFAMLNADRIDVLAMGVASIDFLTHDQDQPKIDIGRLASYRVCYLYFALSNDSPNSDVMDLQNSLERLYRNGHFLAMRRKFDLNADPKSEFIQSIIDPKNRQVGCEDID